MCLVLAFQFHTLWASYGYLRIPYCDTQEWRYFGYPGTRSQHISTIETLYQCSHNYVLLFRFTLSRELGFASFAQSGLAPCVINACSRANNSFTFEACMKQP
jgi:hypothetical protein